MQPYLNQDMDHSNVSSPSACRKRKLSACANSLPRVAILSGDVESSKRKKTRKSFQRKRCSKKGSKKAPRKLKCEKESYLASSTARNQLQAAETTSTSAAGDNDEFESHHSIVHDLASSESGARSSSLLFDARTQLEKNGNSSQGTLGFWDKVLERKYAARRKVLAVWTSWNKHALFSLP